MTGQINKNRLLAVLSKQDIDLFFRDLRPVNLQQRDVLYEIGSPIEHVYFMEGGLASILTTMADGASIEVGMVGFEGMAGFPILLGSTISSQHVVIQIAGKALQLPAAACKAAFDQSGAVRQVFLAFFSVHAQSQRPNGGVQPPAFGRAALCALAIDVERPRGIERAAADAGIHVRHAGHSPRRRDRNRRRAAKIGADTLSQRAYHDHRPQRPGRYGVRMLWRRPPTIRLMIWGHFRYGLAHISLSLTGEGGPHRARGGRVRVLMSFSKLISTLTASLMLAHKLRCLSH